MTIALRFARGVSASDANSTAALALIRALTHHLVDTKRLHTDEIELIRERAIADLPLGSDDPTAIEARMLILHEFP